MAKQSLAERIRSKMNSTAKESKESKGNPLEWTPPVGTTRIRILPPKNEDDDFFYATHSFHYMPKEIYEQPNAIKNTLTGRISHGQVDLSELGPEADALLAMRWIAILRGSTRITLAATGGVHTAADALKMLLAGADVVHLASALLRGGPGVLREILAGIDSWLETHEYESVSQLKGSMSQKNSRDPSAFARAAYLNAIDSFTPPAGVRY